MGNEADYTAQSRALETRLKEQIFDQDMAVEQVSRALLQAKLLHSKSALKALFTFIGPPNSGKHYLPELLSEADADSELLKTFHMDQYSGNFGIGAEQLSPVSIEAEVSAYVKVHPRAILLFEDIEKADLQVQLSLYTLFSDEEKSEADFSQTIVIMTTTRLASLLQRQDIRELLLSDPLEAHTYIMERLAREQMMVSGNKEEAFDRKLLSLLNEHTLIAFNRLSLTTLIKIGVRALHVMSQSFIKESGVSIEYSGFDTLVSLLTLSLAPYLNARHIRQKLPEVMFNHIYEVIQRNEGLKLIRCGVSKEAEAFVRDALLDEQRLIKRVSKQHQRIRLEWSFSEGEEAECNLINAFYTDEKLLVAESEELHVSDVTFADIAGQERVKDELKEVLALFKEPQRLQHFDMEPPKGMVLHGPSGMGKKLLARAFAYEADMPYAVLSGADLFDTPKIHKAYAMAYSSAPAIVILEDIDVQGIVGGMISTMNIAPVVEELDALSQSFESPLFTIVTLSDLESLPESLSKAGRLDIRVEVPKLDMEARRFFIEEVLKKPHDASIDIERVVRYISGMGGNELKRIGQEAALFAARKGLKELSEELLLEQINIIKYGTKLENKQIRDIEKSMAKTAYHEAGHAVLSYILMPQVKIEQVTVAPRSEALGFVSYHHDDYIDASSKEELFNNVCVLLAGRVAKMEKYGEEGMETGAINDLEVATMEVYAAVAIFGMDEELGYININGIESGYERQLMNEKIEGRLLTWMRKAKERTEQEVKRLWPAIEAVAQALIKKEMVDGEELKVLIESTL